MTWIEFFKWLIIIYGAWYAIMIIKDLIYSPRIQSVGDDDDVVEIFHVDDSKPVVLNTNTEGEKVASENMIKSSTKKEPSIEVEEPFNEIKATGGMTVSSLFSKHKDWSVNIVNSIDFK